MSNSVFFFHLADLHIGLKLNRFEEQVAGRIREARYQALENALGLAQKQKVDFIVIAGDVFDDNSISKVDARRVYDMLRGKSVPIFILPGNHDPCFIGSVWHRAPWNELDDTSIHLLTGREPVCFRDDVILYPCPVTRKRSSSDPTDWIRIDDHASDAIHIGIAHGTVMDRDTLPHDDHPIPENCPEIRGLDYLALGHWHGQKTFYDSAGACRMAYPGTQEQMGFGKDVAFSTGWEAYVSDPGRDEFESAEGGKALLVRIDKGEKSPVVESVDVGHFSWVNESYEILDDEHFSKIFSDIASRKDVGQSLLHLKVKGVVSTNFLIQIEAFKQMLGRYAYCELDVDDLHVRPDDKELDEAAGKGILKDVLKALKGEQEKDPDGEHKRTIERAMMGLYRIAMEVKE